MKFECKKCGECCRNLNMSDIYREMHKGDGICIYLNENICTIYEDRPLLCRIEESYPLFQDLFSKNEYYELNYKECRKFIKKYIEKTNFTRLK